MVLLTHGDVSVAAEAAGGFAGHPERSRHIHPRAPERVGQTSGICCARQVRSHLAAGPDDLAEADLCLVLGGDGTMLRAFHLTRDLGHPGRGGQSGACRLSYHHPAGGSGQRASIALLDGEFVEYPLLGLEATIGATDLPRDKRRGGQQRRPLPRLLSGSDHQRSDSFEVLCDGVVAGTPAGSSAYSLAAGGPLLGISVEAYVISLVAPHRSA